MSHDAMVRARMRSRARDERGASALEFALVLPVLVLFLFGIVSYGYMFSVRQALTQAAAEGARAAAVAPTGQAQPQAEAAIESAINDYDAALACGAGGLTCTFDAAPGDCATQCLAVTVDYAYEAHTPIRLLPDALIPDSLSFTSSAEVN